MINASFEHLHTKLKAAETMHLYWSNVVLVRQHALNAFVAQSLGRELPRLPEPAAPQLEPDPERDDVSLDQRTANIIAATVMKFNGNVSVAAKHLGISRSMIYNRLSQ